MFFLLFRCRSRCSRHTSVWLCVCTMCVLCVFCSPYRYPLLCPGCMCVQLCVCSMCVFITFPLSFVLPRAYFCSVVCVCSMCVFLPFRCPSRCPSYISVHLCVCSMFVFLTFSLSFGLPRTYLCSVIISIIINK